MTSLLKIVLMTGALNLFSTVNVEKAGVLSDKSKVIYHLSDDKKMDGPFSISTGESKLFLRGSYKDNKRTGNWYCFNPDGTVFLRYDYDSKKLLALDVKAISRAGFEIKGASEAVKKDASIPVPICSVEQYISLLGTELQRLIFAENKNADGSLDVELTASVDAKGRASYSGTYNANGIPVTKRIKLNEKLFDVEWIPSTYKGEALASTFTVKMQFDLSRDPYARQRFSWNY